MVKKIKEPSLKGGEVEILVRNADMDGIRLHEKLFVFGSYADAVKSLDDLNKNKRTLLADLAKNLKTSFPEHRLFTGCLDSQFEPDLQALGSRTQLEELKNALREYNRRERALVLEKRINRAMEDIKILFKDVVSRHQAENADPSFQKIGLATELLDRSRRGLENRLAHYINPIKRKIIEERVFTQSIIDKVEGCIPELDAERIENSVQRIQSPDARNTINYAELNRELRKDLTKDIKANFVDLVLTISRAEAKKIEDDVADLLLAELGVDPSHPRRTALAEKAREFLDAQTRAVAIRDTAFKPLIERFTVDLIDTMIAQPLGENARKERFLRGKTDLYMLSLFSAQHGLDIPYRSALVSAVLTQQWASVAEKSEVQAHESALVKAMPRQGLGSSQTTSKIVGGVAAILAELVFARGLPVKRVTELMQDISRNLSPSADAAEQLLAVVQGVSGELGRNKEMSNLELAYIEQLLAKIKPSTCEEAVLDEIRTDLANLLHLFKDSVVSAMNLELPFVGAITLYVDTLLHAIEGQAYRQFINGNVAEILHSDFRDIDNDQSRREIRQRMLDMLNDLLRTLEMGGLSIGEGRAV